MNKKGAQSIFGTNFVIAIFLAIVLILFLGGGGVSVILGISSFLKTIPTLLWVVIIIIFIFKFGGKR